MEAVLALLELNAIGASDVQTVSSKSLYNEFIEQTTLIQQLQTKQDYKGKKIYMWKFKLEGALTKWVAMDSSFTNNLFILNNIAKCEVQNGLSEKAKGTFEKVNFLKVTWP